MLTVIVGGTRAGGAEELLWEGMDVGELLSYASTPALLGGPRQYLLRNIIASEQGDAVLDQAKVFVTSPHTFIFQEEKLLKAPTTRLEKAGATIEIVKKKEESKARGFDSFGLTMALASHDRKRLWLGLMAALNADEKPEAIAGLLHWKVRDLLGKRTLSPKERALLTRMSREIVTLYHDSHRGAGELGLLLERFALLLY